MDLLIQAMCAGAINYSMCVTSLQQAAIQTGTTDNYQLLKQYTEHRIHKQLEPAEEYIQKIYKDALKDINKNVLMGIGLVYKIYKDNGIVFSIHPTFANEVGCEFHTSGANVKFKWIW